MIATIYRLAYENPYHETIDIPDDPPEYMQIPCTECDNGIFFVMDEDCFECVECRGAGKKWANMW